jgi:hypothetical protein
VQPFAVAPFLCFVAQIITCFSPRDHDLVCTALQLFRRQRVSSLSVQHCTVIVLKKHYFRRNIMTYRTFAASILALGLLSPAAFAAGSNTLDNKGCPDIRMSNSDYVDCQAGTVTPVTEKFGVVVNTSKARGPIGDFIDETAEEKNQRSSKR